MDKSLLEAAWKLLWGKVRAWWPNLPTDALDHLQGNFDPFVRLVQDKYGYTRKQDKDEVNQRRSSLREILENRIDEEFRRRQTKIETRQKNQSALL